MNKTKFYYDKVGDIAGFALNNTNVGDPLDILMRALLTSDHPEFYNYIEKISNRYLNGKKVLINSVYQFLVVIHQDLSCDLYVNDFQVAIEIKVKRAIQKGELLAQRDIADIRRVKFPEITITEMDRVIYCFKVGWRFGLFFDLIPRVQS